MAEDTDSKRIVSVSLYRPNLAASSSAASSSEAPRKKARYQLRPYHVLFLLAYLCQGWQVLSSIGEPYRLFLEKADREGFAVMEGANKMRAELEHALGDLNDPDRPKEKMGWFDWMDMDIEEANARKRREKEKSVLDSLPKKMRVPGRRAPAFAPTLIFGILVTLNLLVLLMQHWSVGFNVWLNYREVAASAVDIPDHLMEVDLDEIEAEAAASAASPAAGGGGGGGGGGGAAGGGPGLPAKRSPGELLIRRAEEAAVPSSLPTHARVGPATGKDILVPLLYLPTLGMTFEYHRRRYAYDPEGGVWVKIRCRTTMPTSFFAEWEGFDSADQITASHIRYGRNVFDVRQPTFRELYKAQLLSPFTVFQLFCVVLWMLDEYWQYSAFTLFMILMFEGTVVFSRIKSLGALRGMGNKARPVLVYRMGRWAEVGSLDVLPGDILSLTRRRPQVDKPASDAPGGAAKARPADDGGEIVPADVLLLRGSCVVNEASLTGESVPQMKEGMGEIMDGVNLSMKTRHKSHILYAGTKMLQCKGIEMVEAEEGEDGKNGGGGARLYGSIPKPPDAGCLCFVLRTGFSSAQGKLVRMIEGSQEKVKGHERETGLLLLLLFFFALASSSYVLYHGLGDENRSQYELLLHCILIITSVIPPELPMQMALAVNNSLMTLMKMQVFCTEPYRVPMAGKLDSCLFDKTGTLTTDELVAVGVLEAKTLRSGAASADIKELTAMSKVASEAALVLAGCHSLVLIEGETTGDPLESAALEAIRWELAKGTEHVIPKAATEKKEAGKAIAAANATVSELEILARHHFSSKLQRMSCVVKDLSNRRTFAVSKGSPEAIGNLLANKPEGYDAKAKSLSKEGYRVIALAYKVLHGPDEIEQAKETRTNCEEHIIFAGFIAFTCRVRKDTRSVLKKLKEGGMSVTMVTGDALLTAAHVAKEVAICDSDETDDFVEEIEYERNEELRELLKSRRALRRNAQDKKAKKRSLRPILILERNELGSMFWQSYDDDSKVEDFVSSQVPEMATKYDLATTGKNLAAALDIDEGTKQILQHFKIFARMTPDAKETVIECLHSVNIMCLMCGDGANDVGALKGADVGVALLSGFGDVNVDKGEDANKKKETALTPGADKVRLPPEKLEAMKNLPLWAIRAQLKAIGVDPKKYPDLVVREDLIKLYEVKAIEAAIRKNLVTVQGKKMTKAELQLKKKSDMAEKQKKMALRVQELESQGVQWAQFKALKEFMSEEAGQAKQKKAQMAKNRSVEGSAATIAAQLEDLEMDEMPMVKLGDASIAAPFTSKMPSIRSCVDIIRQGRCTLVTSIQMYQILALNCLISAYSLSVLYLDGVKYGDKQMTAMGILGSISFMSVSRSKPLVKLSPVKPLTSIFHPALFISLLGQFAVHLVTMILAVRLAKSHIEPDYKVDLDGEFKPGILNSVVFLCSNVQSVTVFVVNLQGRPFMNGLTENRPLLWSLIASFILTFMFASESVPSLNKYFQLVPFPDDGFRDYIIKILATDVITCLCFDRLMKLMFCPKILFASLEGTTIKDVFSVGKTFAIILFIMNLFFGSNETWDEMIEEEERILAAENSTEGIEGGAIGEAVLEASKTCVGEMCKGANDAKDSMGDEF